MNAKSHSLHEKHTNSVRANTIHFLLRRRHPGLLFPAFIRDPHYLLKHTPDRRPLKSPQVPFFRVGVLFWWETEDGHEKGITGTSFYVEE